jgi:hypothetical protein
MPLRYKEALHAACLAPTGPLIPNPSRIVMYLRFIVLWRMGGNSCIISVRNFDVTISNRR